MNIHYTEANAWQYSFFVPHDVAGLMQLHAAAPTRSPRSSTRCSPPTPRTTGREQADITGLIGQYAHGNEPSHHMAYLYAYAGQPWKTQAMVRRILDTMYARAPDGLAGNEDCGQMSAWFVISALGLYPVAPGSDAVRDRLSPVRARHHPPRKRPRRSLSWRAATRPAPFTSPARR